MKCGEVSTPRSASLSCSSGEPPASASAAASVMNRPAPGTRHEGFERGAYASIARSELTSHQASALSRIEKRSIDQLARAVLERREVTGTDGLRAGGVIETIESAVTGEAVGGSQG